jgi:hypothetical protein
LVLIAFKNMNMNCLNMRPEKSWSWEKLKSMEIQNKNLLSFPS